MIDLVGHFLLFAVIAVLFLIVPLIIGYFVRPKLPTPEKVAIYECGEPTIGSSYIQFDLRFYVVALLFIIFDVEVAFFFPWAMVYGEATQLTDSGLSAEARMEVSSKLLNTTELAAENIIQGHTATTLALTGLADILVFFGVLLVGFSYVWKRGDLTWVRALTKHTQHAPARPKSSPLVEPESSRTPQPVG